VNNPLHKGFVQALAGRFVDAYHHLNAGLAQALNARS
jgi:urate oxidase